MDKARLRAEQLIINGLVSEPAIVHDIMKSISADMFEYAPHKIILESISKIYMEQEPVNLITCYKEIKKAKSIHKQKALEDLTNIHTMFNYLEKQDIASAQALLLSESIRNEHVNLGEKITKLSSSDSYDPKDVLNIIQGHIVDNRFKSILNKKEQSNSELLVELDEKMKLASETQGISGIKTGYNRIDSITSGMQPTNLIIVAARPAMGKTQFALGIIKAASIRNTHKGLFISCEMDEVQVMKRIVSVDSDIPGYSIKRGQLQRNEILRYDHAKKRISEASFKIVAGSFTITEVMSMVYKLKYSEGLDYVVIDYIQKITSPGTQNRTNEVGDVSRKLKDMANELKIPVVALAQLSRAVEHRNDKKPILSDLRESGDIEQDADIVMFLYRAGYYMDIEEKRDNPLADDGYVVIAKHRDGELEDVHLKFDSNVPAWKDPNQRDEYEPPTQSVLKPNKEFDWQGSQPF
jgi:replicative DNA helicase